CNAFINEAMDLYTRDEEGVTRPYDFIEHIVSIATSRHGLAAFAEDKLNVLNVINQHHATLNKEFKSVRWPQILNEVKEAREKYKPGKIIRGRKPKI
ncbi:MAG: hypothetical protein MJA83_12540, partial [Gammaproteobacteria bacterium]|nr:hypothetical protein [Gammaproteobacteria bacterium]